jgi:hypothetical protein
MRGKYSELIILLKTGVTSRPEAGAYSAIYQPQSHSRSNRQGGWLCDLAYESHHTVPLFLSKPYCRCHSPSSYALLVHFSFSPEPAIGRQMGKSTLQTACFVP